MEDLPKNRLGFAKWLVAHENPLAARVLVNRAWSAFFGTGIVKTVDDFGLQGEAPSHPELLDWLAVACMDQDAWSVKELHRRIVSSSTYRQSSQVPVGSRPQDPDNRLLGFFPRQRLEAEVLRDSYLAMSGKLSTKMGGAPVKPPQPKGVTEDAYGSPKWNPSAGEDRFRRSIYTKIKRTAPFAMFSTFDAPSGESCVARRPKSNSPLQALTLLNDPMIVELAVASGERAIQAETREALDALFRSVLTRAPSELEREALLAFLEQQIAEFRDAPENADKLLGTVAKNKSPGEKAAIAAWAALTRALFALDETQTKG
ncbi:MAG: DUF1553 domain-containing protein [Planctomycetota bacterium]